MSTNLENAIGDIHDSVTTSDVPAWSSLPAKHGVLRWYAAYTSANHEKRVAEQLLARDVDHFLPSYTSVRRWSDRRVRLQLPLFPGYVFVHMALRDRLRVLQVAGLSRLVGFGGTPTPLPEEEIDALRAGLVRGAHAVPHPHLAAGRRVQVKEGPFAGLKGILLRWKGNWRVVLSLDLIQRSVAVDVDISAIEPADAN